MTFASDNMKLAVSRARSLAEQIEHSEERDEIDFESKRLNVLLGCLSSRCHCEHCVTLAEAYAKSRSIYASRTVDEAHAAAHEVADILSHVA